MREARLCGFGGLRNRRGGTQSSVYNPTKKSTSRGAGQKMKSFVGGSCPTTPGLRHGPVYHSVREVGVYGCGDLMQGPRGCRGCERRKSRRRRVIGVQEGLGVHDDGCESLLELGVVQVGVGYGCPSARKRQGLTFSTVFVHEKNIGNTSKFIIGGKCECGWLDAERP